MRPEKRYLLRTENTWPPNIRQAIPPQPEDEKQTKKSERQFPDGKLPEGLPRVKVEKLDKPERGAVDYIGPQKTGSASEGWSLGVNARLAGQRPFVSEPDRFPLRFRFFGGVI